MTINAIQLMIGYDVIALKSDIDDQNLLLVTVHMYFYFFTQFVAFLSKSRTSLRNLTLTIQVCDISQSFVSATKYEKCTLI
jgi:hypothetical protein